MGRKVPFLVVKVFFVFLSLFCIVDGKIFFHEKFDSLDGWVVSENMDKMGKFELGTGEFIGDPVSQQGLKLVGNNKHFAISKKLPTPFKTNGKSYVISYSVKSEQNLQCAGTHIKLFSEDFDPEMLDDETPYLLKFGPERCNKKDDFFISKNFDGKIVEWKYLLRPHDEVYTHFYTVAFYNDNTFELFLDGEANGKRVDIEKEFPVLEPKFIPDPSHVKPFDWVDSPIMPDPNVVLPDMTHEEEPDEDKDGVPLYELKKEIFRRPLKSWSTPHVPNPNYKGPFIQRKIPNPNYVPNDKLYELPAPIAYVGIEVYQEFGGSIYDDIMISYDLKEVLNYVRNQVKAHHEVEKKMYTTHRDRLRDIEDRHKKDIEEGHALANLLAVHEGIDL